MDDRCESVEPLLSAWADAELDGPRKQAVTRHLAGCRDCALVLEDVVAVRRMVRNLPERRVAAELVLVAPLRALARPAPLPRRVKALAVAASLLLGAALGLGGGAGNDLPPAPEPTDMFMADFPSDQLARTYGAPVTTPALLESRP